MTALLGYFGWMHQPVIGSAFGPLFFLLQLVLIALAVWFTHGYREDNPREDDIPAELMALAVSEPFDGVDEDLPT